MRTLARFYSLFFFGRGLAHKVEELARSTRFLPSLCGKHGPVTPFSFSPYLRNAIEAKIDAEKPPHPSRANPLSDQGYVGIFESIPEMVQALYVFCLEEVLSSGVQESRRGVPRITVLWVAPLADGAGLPSSFRVKETACTFSNPSRASNGCSRDDTFIGLSRIRPSPPPSLAATRAWNRSSQSFLLSFPSGRPCVQFSSQRCSLLTFSGDENKNIKSFFPSFSSSAVAVFFRP